MDTENRAFKPELATCAQVYPLKSAVRAQKIADLQAQYGRSTRINITWVNISIFTDGVVVKACMSAVAEILLEGKQKEELCEKIKQIPMSASSATKKTEILTQDVLVQLDEAIHKAPCIGWAVDESTNVSDNTQLLINVRFFNEEENTFCEDL